MLQACSHWQMAQYWCVFRISEWAATEIQEFRGETTVAAAAVAAFDIVRSFNQIRATLPDLIRETRDFTTAALAASVHARDKVGTTFWGRGCLIFSNVQHSGSGRGAWSPWQDFYLAAGRFAPRVRLLRQGVQQSLGLRNMQLVAKFTSCETTCRINCETTCEISQGTAQNAGASCRQCR